MENSHENCFRCKPFYSCACTSCETYKCLGSCSKDGLNEFAKCEYYSDWITKLITGKDYINVFGRT